MAPLEATGLAAPAEGRGTPRFSTLSCESGSVESLAGLSARASLHPAGGWSPGAFAPEWLTVGQPLRGSAGTQPPPPVLARQHQAVAHQGQRV